MNQNETRPGEHASVTERVGDLLGRMTLEEKTSQMLFTSPAIERLGIPAHNWWNEALHGLGRAGVATVFPQAIGLAATWNPGLLRRVADVISDEARAKHHEAARRGMRQIYTGLTFWSPNVNIFRDPRWGRGQETYGEDPYLTAAMGVAFINGLQGDDSEHLKLVATAKHYAVHSGPEADRHHFDARVDVRDLRDTYLPAFEACVKEARVEAVMGAYNRTNGEPCCASPTLLEEILRQEWGFAGHVVSDCWAIVDIYAHHQVVDTPAQAAALAINNGCDLECGSVYEATLEAVKLGLLDEATIDRAVSRLLDARMRLGMFDPPHASPYGTIPYTVIDSEPHRALALETARESIVLLKNDGLLPLPSTLDSVAVVGPNADDLVVLLGNYNGTPSQGATVLAGIRKKLGADAQVYYARGCALADGVPNVAPIPAPYLRPSANEAGATGLTGAYFDNEHFNGEPAFTRTDQAVDFVWKDTSPLQDLWGDHFAVRWTGNLIPPVSGAYQIGVTGYSAYKLWLDGELLMEHEDMHHPVMRLAQVELEAGRLYDVRLEYANWGLDPQVRLLWARPDEDELRTALEVAAKADVIIAALGLSPRLEGEEFPVVVEGFDGDRTYIELPPTQLTLLQELAKLGKPIVLVTMSGSALAIPWAAENIPAIVQAWYPGQAAGQAIADVLFGDTNPAGRLPVTFYRSTDDLPPFDDYAMAGRTYRYFGGDVLYPFGHGLSYTTFAYANLHVAQAAIAAHETAVIRVDVTNQGERAGDEVVQLYVTDTDASVARPRMELAGFQRIHLAPGETRTVTFEVAARQLGFYHEEMGYVVEPGEFRLHVGRSSADLPLATTLTVTGDAAPIPTTKSFFSQTSVAG
ncbi:MAG: glycoside hydrolase family 3 C-terminal domain-containing protein [Caldilineaceae bacterium]|nr:glycoside hydrolase family 3 C-terminal domain-containing protein [Caldilineaceae bacterium]